MLGHSTVTGNIQSQNIRTFTELYRTLNHKQIGWMLVLSDDLKTRNSEEHICRCNTRVSEIISLCHTYTKIYYTNHMQVCLHPTWFKQKLHYFYQQWQTEDIFSPLISFYDIMVKVCKLKSLVLQHMNCSYDILLGPFIWTSHKRKIK